MRLLHIIHTLAVEGGGSTTAVMGMCDALAARGHEVTVFSIDDDRRLPKMSGRQWKLRLFRAEFPPLGVSLGMWRALVGLHCYDLVHIHQLYRAPQAMAAHYARRFCVPYCVQPHGSLDPWAYFKRERRRTKRLYERLIEKRNLKGAAALIYTAQGEADAAEFLKLDRPALIVPNGLNISDYTQTVDATVFRQRYGLIGRTVILFLGLLVQRKGLDILAQAFASIAALHPQAMLVLAGPDTEGCRDDLEQRFVAAGLRHRVVFTGMIEGNEKLAALQLADFLVLPSYEENFGMVIVEAMASGSPVVISKNVKIWTDVVRAGAGLAVAAEADALAGAMMAMLADPEASRRMGASAAAFVRSYDWSVTVQQLEAAYRQILTTHGGIPRLNPQLQGIKASSRSR